MRMEDLRKELLKRNTSRLEIFQSGEINEEERTAILTYSSEAPVERWFGIEVLSHAEGAQDMARMNAAAPLLFNHDPDKVIGVVLEARVTEGRGLAKVKFSRNKAGEEAFQDVRDGILKNVSFRYSYDEVKLLESGAQRSDGLDVFLIPKYTGMEISMVSIPADISVGIGRSFDDVNAKREKAKRSEEEKETQKIPEPETKKEEVKMKIESNEDSGMRNQMLEMMDLGEKFQKRELARKFIEAGRSLDELRKEILMSMESKPIESRSKAEEIGLTQEESRKYSLVNALRAAATGDWRGAEFEREVSLATQKKYGKETAGFLVPSDVLRSLTKAPGANGDLSGGAFISEDLETGSFIDLLRNKLVVRRLGATVLSNLRGDIAIPRQTGGASAYWVSEGNAPTESKMTTDQVKLSPKTVGAFTDISRKLLLQSSVSVNQFVMDDIASVIAREIDRVTLFGKATDASGNATNQPVGIVNQTGVANPAIGATGGKLTYAKLVELEERVSEANADVGSLAYLTNARVRGSLKTTLKADAVSGYLWEGTMGDGDGMVNGYRCAVSNVVPGNLSKTAAGATKGNLSAILYGNFSDIIIGEWSVLDMMVNPYGPGSDAGTVRIRALQDIDVAIRHPQSFAYFNDVWTSATT